MRESGGRASGEHPNCAWNGVGDFPQMQAASFGGSDELVLVGEGRRCSSRGNIEFGEDVADVPINRLLAQG